MFEGFTHHRIDAGGTEIALVRGGQVPPVLLLHGYPQTHLCWHEVAPALARRHTVIAPDLRGYGDSAKPAGGADHGAYAKREMARDQVEVMRRLGFERFAVVGHDRGARVAHRMALDHPERLRAVAVLDIVPTRTVFATVSKALALAWYHWFFLAQPHDLPERMIGADPAWWVDWTLASWSASGLEPFAPEALAAYRASLASSEAIHATCEDYRAGATIDGDHDEADAHRRVEVPLLALWGERGKMAELYDILATWREIAADVRGRALPCGHFLAEEAPAETVAELEAFLGETESA